MIVSRSFTACVVAVVALFCIPAQAKSPRVETDLSGSGWKMWLDTSAKWKNDKLYLPPVDFKSLPVNPPTVGWDKMYSGKAIDVSVPGTVEEYCWDTLAQGKPKFQDSMKMQNRANGDYVGVSWWWREINIPASAIGKKITLHFEAVRLRAEVFLNNEFVGYDVIGNTPFDVDITGKVKPGKNMLAVRVTDPSGNFDWVDWVVHKWGDYSIPASHGFGGIFQPASLIITGPVYISDIFIKNKPELTTVDVDVTLSNTTGNTVSGDVELSIKSGRKTVKTATIPGVEIQPGDKVVTKSITVPDAKLWDTEHPNLYTCEVKLVTGKEVRDIKSDRFGFRFFNVSGTGSEAVFRLNGKRVFLHSAISWGFFPINGIYPSEAMAVKQIKTAKAFGMNMLNFHRTLGNKLMLDKANELGLMHYEEPGGYANTRGDEFSAAWAREKLLRMVKRDRNHPSLVIRNLINESEREPLPNEYIDMADAHKLDPTRIITFTSLKAKELVDDPLKLHMLPYDDKQYIKGWFDVHHAPGPGVYRETYYSSPDTFMLHTDDKAEIVFWGEEGAISTPSRLELINKDLSKSDKNGWDGEWYKAWYQAYVDFLDKKGLRKYFPTVDSLTKSMGNLSMYYQGRILENCRVGNVTDGYVTNGWEAEIYENHSGIVDCWRNPKGDPNLIARYNRPLYVAVKIRNKTAQVPMAITTDFYVVNQVDLKGAYTLKASLVAPDGKTISEMSWPVNIVGGDTQGQLLQEAVTVKTGAQPGYYTMKAVLLDGAGKVVADGDDQALTVDWKSSVVPPNGALLDAEGDVGLFFETLKNAKLPSFSPQLGKLDYVIVGVEGTEAGTVVPTQVLTSGDGKPGLTAEYFSGTNFEKSILKKVDAKVDYPESDVALEPGTASDFSVRWTGKITPTKTADYLFYTQSDDGVRLWINGELIIDKWVGRGFTTDTSPKVTLEGGKSYDIKVEYFQGGMNHGVVLRWNKVSSFTTKEMLDDLLRRVKEDGTTVVFANANEELAKALAERGAIKYNGTQTLGVTWVGGNIFVCDHPLFKGLPVNQGMNWEYQSMIPYSVKRFGFLLDGEEVVAGTVNYNEPRLGTAVGIVDYGKGKIVLSTLNMKTLSSDSPGADIVRKLMCNYVEFAGGVK